MNPQRQKRLDAYRKSCYLVRLQRQEFDPATGRPKFAPFEQWYTPDEFKRLKEYPDGHTIVEIIQDPTATPETAEEDTQEETKTRNPRKR
jgi:hypothetical protein